MATWREVEASAPELAAAIRGRFDAHRHETLTTLRRDDAQDQLTADRRARVRRDRSRVQRRGVLWQTT